MSYVKTPFYLLNEKKKIEYTDVPKELKLVKLVVTSKYLSAVMGTIGKGFQHS